MLPYACAPQVFAAAAQPVAAQPVAAQAEPVFALPQGGSQAPKASAEEGNALAAFTVRFRQQGEEKDAKEREAKAARKAAGKAALKKMLGERNDRVASRKAANRESEKAVEKDMLSGLSGESWSRVVSLIDTSAAAHGKEEAHAGEKKAKVGGAASSASASGDAAKAAGGVNDTLRLKDVSCEGGRWREEGGREGGRASVRTPLAQQQQLTPKAHATLALPSPHSSPQILVVLKSKPL